MFQALSKALIVPSCDNVGSWSSDGQIALRKNQELQNLVSIMGKKREEGSEISFTFDGQSKPQLIPN